MARILLSSAGGAASGFGTPWFVWLCMVVASVLLVSFAVFLCGRSSHADDCLPKKKPATTTKVRPSARSGTAVYTTGMYGTAYGGAAIGGCSGGHGGHGGGGCGGGGGGGGCGGGGGGGGC